MNCGYWKWLLLAWLAGLSCAGPRAAWGQNVSAAESLLARQPLAPVRPPATDSTRRPPYLGLLSQLNQQEARRLARVAVVRVRNPSDTDSTRFQLNDEVILDVRDLRLALRRAHRPASDLRLYVDDIALPMPPVAVDTLRRRNVATVRFQLVRNATTEPIWQLFYQVPGKYEHSSTFNVGFDTGQLGQAYPQGQGRLHLELVQTNWLLVGLALLALLGWTFGWLVRNSNFVRSDLSRRIPLDAAGLASVLNRGYRQVPYSLAKSQVAYWTLLVVAAYLMISLVTSALPTIPNGLLGLLGISIANGLFSSIISRPTTSPDAPAPVPKGEVDYVGQSRGWFQDVLTDATGISVVRLQFVVFNVIAGLYLVRQVLAHWALPDFDSSLLTLISISSAGFLVQKNSEANATRKAAGAGPAGGGGQLPPEGGNIPPAGAQPEPTEPLEDNEGSSEPTEPADDDDGNGEPAAAPAATRAALPRMARPAVPPGPSARQAWNTKLANFLAQPVVYDSDPSRAIFGPLPSTANGCQLQVSLAATLMGGLDLVATVTSTAERPAPLTGQVVLLLHPTYRQRVVTVPIVRGQATYRFFSAGCYTLVAMLDEGATLLAFDLTNVPGAPSSFLEN